ncbi:MAG: hypothetical protein V1750_08565 [Acidobacteriota bacterium]
MKFSRFLSATLGATLSPAQRVWVRVALDGCSPKSLAGPDRGLCAQLFGPIEHVPAAARDVLALLKGARAGGSWLSSLYLLFAALTVDLGSLAPGERAFGIAVGPDIRLARQILRYASGAARSCPSIAPLVALASRDSLLLRRPDGREVSIEVLPATQGGRATRGRSLVAAVLDESSFFRDAETGVVNDAEIFRSVSPRVLTGGRTIVLSTAWLQSGLLWQLIQENHGRPETCLAAIAPTALMRPDAPKLARVIAAERVRDPDNAAREFDCQPFGGAADAFFDGPSIAAAATAPALEATGSWHAAGCDFGFRTDSSTIAIVRRRGEHYELVDWLELRPTRGAPLKPSEVCEQFATIAKRHSVTALAADSHYVESVREHLGSHSLDLEEPPGGQDAKAESYVALRALLHEGRLHLPERATRMLAQLRAVVARPLPGGGLSVSSPRSRVGGHGDLASALVLAVWSAGRFSVNSGIYVPPWSLEHGFRYAGARGF